jgi:hypothetical protein
MRQFERELQEIRRKCSDRRKIFNQQIQDIRGFWNDDKYRIFLQKQEKLDHDLLRLEQRADEYCDFLRRKAAAADEYLGR